MQEGVRREALDGAAPPILEEAPEEMADPIEEGAAAPD